MNKPKKPKTEAFWQSLAPKKKFVKAPKAPVTPKKKSGPPTKQKLDEHGEPLAKPGAHVTRQLPPKLAPYAEVRLNRFISHCGVCARRDADKLIAEGLIRVNGTVVTELGTKVQPGKDVVTYKGNKLEIQRFVYILLNKPKNMITTTDDPAGRPTVLDAIESAARTRVFPVGRLDRNTTGLLLLTNDGKLTEKLTHPAHGIRKMYKVKLNKPVEETDFDKLLKGVELEDGVAKFDKIDFVEGKEQDEVGVEVTSGKNSIVRLLFEALGYEVVSLDRTMFGPLTKKRLPRGEWRLLSKEEISFLHMQ